uniref:ribonucleotide reductase N-terminal alpha domain-containing protein n=1 Tax=uncultured Corynebacterium sp. TaxID=159447 RepID=UPI0026159B63
MQTYLKLNAELNLLGPDGEIQTDKDKEAARQYFLEHVNPDTVFFHTLNEKINYLCRNDYWDENVFGNYTGEEVKSLFRKAYSYKFRFPTFVGAYKFYTSYALKNYEGDRYLERYEDRVCMVALTLADGDYETAEDILQEIMTGRYQPATPTFLNAGRGNAGDMVSCFLLRIEDNMESIGRSITNALQLSKRGGG